MASFSYLCRLCGITMREVGSDIFSENKQSFEKIKFYFRVELFCDSKLSRRMCESCLFEMENFDSFKDRCVKAQKSFESMVGRKCFKVLEGDQQPEKNTLIESGCLENDKRENSTRENNPRNRVELTDDNLTTGSVKVINLHMPKNDQNSGINFPIENDEQSHNTIPASQENDVPQQHQLVGRIKFEQNCTDELKQEFLDNCDSQEDQGHVKVKSELPMQEPAAIQLVQKIKKERIHEMEEFPKPKELPFTTEVFNKDGNELIVGTQMDDASVEAFSNMDNTPRKSWNNSCLSSEDAIESDPESLDPFADTPVELPTTNDVNGSSLEALGFDKVIIINDDLKKVSINEGKGSHNLINPLQRVSEVGSQGKTSSEEILKQVTDSSSRNKSVIQEVKDRRPKPIIRLSPRITGIAANKSQSVTTSGTQTTFRTLNGKPFPPFGLSSSKTPSNHILPDSPAGDLNYTKDEMKVLKPGYLLRELLGGTSLNSVIIPNSRRTRGSTSDSIQTSQSTTIEPRALRSHVLKRKLESDDPDYVPEEGGSYQSLGRLEIVQNKVQTGNVPTSDYVPVHNRPRIKVITCPICDKHVRNAGHLVNHMATHSTGVPTSSTTSGDKGSMLCIDLAAEETDRSNAHYPLHKAASGSVGVPGWDHCPKAKFTERYHFPVVEEGRRRFCVMCLRIYNRRIVARTICNECKVALCLGGCFQSFHSGGTS